MTASSIRALVLPVGDEPARLVRVTADLDTLQGLVGGNIEALPLATEEATMWLNEDGKYAGFPLNANANVLVRALGVGLAPDDFIVGQVVITGDRNADGKRDGDDHDVPESVLSACRRNGLVVDDRT